MDECRCVFNGPMCAVDVGDLEVSDLQDPIPVHERVAGADQSHLKLMVRTSYCGLKARRSRELENKNKGTDVSTT